MFVLEVRNANKHKIPIRFASVRVCTGAAQPAVVNLCNLGVLRLIVTILQTTTTFVRFSCFSRLDGDSEHVQLQIVNYIADIFCNLS